MMARPLPEYISHSKAHRHVNLMFPNPDEYHQLVLKAYLQDGFKETLSFEVGMEPYHYPNFQTDWFEKAVEFLDAPPTPAMIAATQKFRGPSPLCPSPRLPSGTDNRRPTDKTTAEILPRLLPLRSKVIRKKCSTSPRATSPPKPTPPRESG